MASCPPPLESVSGGRESRHRGIWPEVDHVRILPNAGFNPRLRASLFSKVIRTIRAEHGVAAEGQARWEAGAVREHALRPPRQGGAGRVGQAPPRSPRIARERLLGGRYRGLQRW